MAAFLVPSPQPLVPNPFLPVPQYTRILLIEDDPDDVWVMRNLLADSWDGVNELTHVERLETALKLCQKREFDVILLDLTLPDSHGIETFLRAYAQVPHIPIVILTALNDQSAANQAVEGGAEDFLLKGRVDDHLLLRSIRYAVERSRRRKAENDLQATRHEFQLARTMQQRLFPSGPPNVPGFRFSGATYPAEATGGDLFDYFPMLGGGWGIVIADVSEHGIGPSFLMAETRAYIRALARSHADAGVILTEANRLLCEDTAGTQFVTLVLARLEPESKTLVYAAAGHIGFLFNAAGECRRLDSTSQPLGFDPDLIVPCADPIQLAAGDLVLLATDGVYEAPSPDGSMFGLERMLNVVRENRDLPPQSIVDNLRHAVGRFSQPLAQIDDITIVALQVAGR